MVVLIALSTFAIVWLLVYESGPGNIVYKFRDWFRDRFKRFGGVVDCPICASWWVAVPVTVVGLLCEQLLYPFAAIAVCVVLFSFVGVSDG